MKVEKGRALAVYAATTVASSVYLPTLLDISTEHGFWFTLPIWLTLLVGIVAISEWLRKVSHPKSHPSYELAQEQYPRPSVKAYDWDIPFEATEQAIGEAFDSATRGQNKGLVIFAKDWSRLDLEWEKEGWAVKWLPEGDRVSRVAVPFDSEWRDKELMDKGWGGLFRSMPTGHVDDATAIRLVSSFLGWEEQPDNVAWATIRHADAEE